MPCRHTCLNTFTSAVALAVVSSLPLSAHDLWIEPSSFAPAVDSVMRVHLRVGELFSGDPVARNEAKLVRFAAVGPDGERPIAGRDGVDPAGILRIDRPGVWILAYRGRPSPVTLEGPAFEKYLKEEGLERIIEERRTRNETTRPGRERFSRSVKALVRAGASSTTGFDRPAGLPFEIILEADPFAPNATRLPVQLHYNDAPLRDTQIVAIRRDAMSRAAGRVAWSGRSDGNGRATLGIGPGAWLIKAVHMERAAPGSDAEWESVWTSLTFEIR